LSELDCQRNKIHTTRQNCNRSPRTGANGTVECWVADNGSGIPTELLDKVFDKGETNPQDDGGLGLGLAIVKTFTEAHGGKVSVESKELVGSTFRFSLPGRSEASS